MYNFFHLKAYNLFSFHRMVVTVDNPHVKTHQFFKTLILPSVSWEHIIYMFSVWWGWYLIMYVICLFKVCGVLGISGSRVCSHISSVWFCKFHALLLSTLLLELPDIWCLPWKVLITTPCLFILLDLYIYAVSSLYTSINVHVCKI